MKTTTKQIRSNAALASVSGKPLTAYNFFFREQRLTMLRNGETIPKGSGTISRVVATKWKKLDAVARCQYEFKAQVERNMYDLKHSDSWKSVKMPSPTKDTIAENFFSAPPSFFKEFSPRMQSQPSLKNSASGIKKISSKTDLELSSDDKKFDASQFQMRVCASLQESTLDKDFVDFVLSLKLV